MRILLERNQVKFSAAVAAIVICTTSSHCLGQGPRPLPRRNTYHNVLSRPADWYSSEEAARIADNVLLYQHENGGWPKNVNMARPLTDDERAELAATRHEFDTTIDNRATFTETRLLARVHHATGDERYAEACRRGLEYLLAAQYENGGWPQFYPTKRGYYRHITFNDGAMIGAMSVLRDVASGQVPFEFVDAELRQRAATATKKGLDVILRCQIKVNGQLTAWCAQHDEEDFSPQPARSYELASLSGMESVGIVEYLMEIDNPSPAVHAAIQAAARWFEEAKLEGIEVRRERDASAPRGFDTVVVPNPSAPPMWARFYEIGTNRPLFVGRDGIPRPSLADIEAERRAGYSWLGHYADDLLETKVPAWQQKWGDD